MDLKMTFFNRFAIAVIADENSPRYISRIEFSHSPDTITTYYLRS